MTIGAGSAAGCKVLPNHYTMRSLAWCYIVHASLAALAFALESNDWVAFPGGRLVHSSCIHWHTHTSSPSQPLPPCQHIHPTYPQTFASGYYGGWSVYSFLPANRSLGHMSATFKVPPTPSSLGPLGLSSLYMSAPFHSMYTVAVAVCQWHD